MKHLGYRKGQWVLYGSDKRIGILVHEHNTYTEGDRVAKRLEWNVHLVAEDGTTSMVLPNIHPLSIQPAKREHIPASRLATSSQEALDKHYPV